MRVILPEGAQVVSVKSKVDIKLLPEERRFTYLDTPLTGRTVVTLEAFNLVDQSNDKLTVSMHTHTLNLLVLHSLICGIAS